jgi:flagellin
MGDVALTSGMRANLLNLQGTVSLMSRTQERLASGKKVNTALDNPTNYFTAQTHINRANDIASRKDSMGEAIQTVKAANTGIQGIKTLIESAKGIAQSALGTSDTLQRATYASQYNAVISQISTLASDSGYKGTNLLNGNTLSVIFNESGNSSLAISGFDATATGLSTNFISGSVTTSSATNVGSWADITNGTTNINSALNMLATATTTLRTQASSLSSSLSVVQTRSDWADQMISTLNTGADNLTSADMNEEGANMLMLQTRQSLSTTALSLSAQAAQSVLRLF